MTKTLKERADEIVQKDYNWFVKKIVDEGSFLDIEARYELQKLQNLIRDQQARIEELEAKTQWKPIAEMPEELKDGQWIFIKGNGYNGACISWCDMEQMFHSQDMNWYGKDTITHFMEIPE